MFAVGGWFDVTEMDICRAVVSTESEAASLQNVAARHRHTDLRYR